MADWSKIKAEYIRSRISTRKLAEKYNVSYTMLCKHSKAEKWVELRRQKESKKTAAVVDACATKEANEAIKIYEVADKAIEVIEKMLTEHAEEIGPVAIRSLTGALKDIAAVKGLQTEAEKREQEARIAKLRKEAERDEQQDKTIEIVMDSSVEDYCV